MTSIHDPGYIDAALLQAHPRKRREDSFLGIHFDFHAMPGEVVPALWHPEYYTAMLDAVNPDFVQCDTKGHPGLSSYPTEAGTRSGQQSGIDILKMMREETAKRGIALYGHHSGLYELNAGELHPDWQAVDHEGNPIAGAMSVFGPYCDERLLPQIRELAECYHLDGAWIDGECWWVYADYSHWAQEAAAKAGVKVARPGEPGCEAYREFCRQGFRDYVEHYIQAIHREFPGFQITSNWIWSGYMPEKDSGTADFLSGDYSCTNSVLSARTQARIIEARNRIWDLIDWGHQAIPCSWMTHNRSTKELGQQCQEAAMIIAMGGAFLYFNIHYGLGGAIQKWAIPVWEKTAEFCRAREVCLHARIRPELGVLFPADRNDPEETAALYNGAPGLEAAARYLNILQDSQYSAKVVLNYQLEESDLARYQVIVIPETRVLSAAALARLKRFAEAGGSIVADSGSADLFAGWGISAGPEADELIFVNGRGALAAGEVACRAVEGEGLAPWGERYPDNIYDVPFRPAGMVKTVGRGKLALLTFGLGRFYRDNQSTAIRNFLRDLLEEALGYSPAVRVTGSRFSELVVTEKDGDLLVNLLNLAGEHHVPGVRSYGEIPPVGPFSVTLSSDIPAGEITEFPGGKKVTAVKNPDGSRTFTADRLEIHQIYVISGGAR